MKNMTAATKTSIGLVCSMVGILMISHHVGILPDREKIDISHRDELSEAVALTATAMLLHEDLKGLSSVLDGLVGRRADLLSIGVVAADGQLLIDTGGHEQARLNNLQDRSNDRFMEVPLGRPDNPEWGRIELRFTSAIVSGASGRARNHFYAFLLFASTTAFFVFRTFLRHVMNHLEPSRAVPQRVREALDILAEGLMIIGMNGRILLANNALADMTGRAPDEMLGMGADELGFHQDNSSADAPWHHAIRTGRPQTNISMQLADDTGVQILKVNCSPLLGNEGQYHGVMVTFDDVTQLEKKKRELKAAKEDAEAANQAKSDFVANMSHELRNPMNAIVGFTDILRRGLEDDPDTRTDYLNIIHASGTHLVGLINNILDLSKIEAGRMDLEICETSPWQIVSEVVAVMSGKAQEQGLLLECSVDGLIPSVIQSDPTRLRQILMNLVGNAIKFTSEGSVRIVARIEGAGRSPRLTFSVTDTGIGMTKRQCDRIFEKFVQADSSVTRRFGGTGLGLAISKRLTEALGGKIVVSSEPGVGSTFSFSVSTGPLSGVRMLDSKEASASLTMLQEQQSGLQIRFKPVRVLVTDDTPANRKLVGLVLRKAGLTVDEAENGQQAVDMVMANKYDLVLMDMQMPVMDGFTATSTLRAAGLTLPIIALTANVMNSDRERCESSGCNGFLIKPIDIDQLLSTLAEYLELTDVAPPATAPADPTAADPRLSRIPTIAPSSDSRVLESTLPTDIPEFREIVDQFINMLTPMMDDMQTAWVDRNFAKLQDLAHKLKGTGGTVGFTEFTAPAERLHRQMELRTEDDVEQLLAELMELSQAAQRSETTIV